MHNDILDNTNTHTHTPHYMMHVHAYKEIIHNYQLLRASRYKYIILCRSIINIGRSVVIMKAIISSPQQRI